VQWSMDLRQSNPIQMFIKLGSAMIPWNSDSQTLYRCLSSWAVPWIIALPSLINICIWFDWRSSMGSLHCPAW
jgi:hypothetical protein